MSDKDVERTDAGSGRLIRKAVITYRLADDAEGTERTFALEHGGGGEAVDGLIWSEELIRKLAYLEAGECREPEKGAGAGEWKVYSTNAASDGGGKCVWVHDSDCNWWEYCDQT